MSDTRTLENDKSGDTLQGRIEGAGHTLAAREIVKDDADVIVEMLNGWIADEEIDVVITTGGTVLNMPTASPWINTVAGPVSEALAMDWVG